MRIYLFPIFFVFLVHLPTIFAMEVDREIHLDRLQADVQKNGYVLLNKENFFSDEELKKALELKTMTEPNQGHDAYAFSNHLRYDITFSRENDEWKPNYGWGNFLFKNLTPTVIKFIQLIPQSSLVDIRRLAVEVNLINNYVNLKDDFEQPPLKWHQDQFKFLDVDFLGFAILESHNISEHFLEIAWAKNEQLSNISKIASHLNSNSPIHIAASIKGIPGNGYLVLQKFRNQNGEVLVHRHSGFSVKFPGYRTSLILRFTILSEEQKRIEEQKDKVQ